MHPRPIFMWQTRRLALQRAATAARRTLGGGRRRGPRNGARRAAVDGLERDIRRFSHATVLVAKTG